jgi:hypothetical protein
MSRRDEDHRPKCTGTTARGTRCTKLAQPGSTRCAHHGFDVKAIGRPSSLTPELADNIVGLVLEGNYIKTAAEASGISERLLYRWIERADHIEAQVMEHHDGEDVDLYEHVDPALWLYLDFRQSLKSAAAYAETELLRMVRNPGFGPWQAAMTILERRKPDHWRRRDTRELEVPGGIAITVQDVRPEGEARDEILEVLEQAGAARAAAANRKEQDGDD